MNIKKTRQLAFQFYIICMPLIFAISLLFFALLDNDIHFLITGFLFIFLFTVLYSIKYYGILSLYSIFLYTSSFFLYNAFWFTLFDKNKNFLKLNFPKLYYFDDYIGIKFIIYSVLLTYVMHIAYCLANNRRFHFRKTLEHNVCFEKTGIAIMLIFLVPSIVKLYIQFTYIRKYGYLAMFRGDLLDIKYPIWTTGANLLFITGFSIFLAANPSKRKFILFSILFFLLMVFDAAKGQRGIVLAPLVALLYWFVQKYNIKIKLGTLLFLFIIIIGVTYGLGAIRSSYGQNRKVKSENLKIIDLVSNVLYSQTTSRAVPMKILEDDLPFHNYPFIFSPMFRFFGKLFYHTNGQDNVLLQKFNDISSITIYTVSPNAYYQGKGYGGAFIAEAYDCGGFIGIIIWGIILAHFIAFCDYSKLHIKNIYIPFLFLTLLNFAMLPRDRFFAVLNNHFPKILILFLILPIIGKKCIWRYMKNE